MGALRARGGIVIGALAVCALVLTGCAAGKKAQTAKESPAIDGVGASVGSMLIREAAIAAPAGASYAKGDSAQLRITIVNNGGTPDSLTSVTTTAAASVTITAAGSSGSASPSDTASDTSSASSTATATDSAAPTDSSSAGGGAFSPVTIGANSSVQFNINSGDQSLLLTGLTQALFPATVVSITFTFQNAGSVTVQVPVQLSHSENPTGQVVTAGETTESSATE